MRVLILAGGISHERDVSLKSGRRVADALADAGVEVEIKEPDDELIGHLIATRPDVVWSTLHGSVGEDGSLQDILATRPNQVCWLTCGISKVGLEQIGCKDHC